MSSPAQWEKLGKSWEAFAKTPSGTGPWKLTLFAPRERAEMVPNKEYWDKARIPKLDKLVLLPLPEPNARVRPCAPAKSIGSKHPRPMRSHR